MNEREIWSLVQGTPQILYPLTLEVIELEPRFENVRPEAFIRLRWGTRSFDFVAASKTLSTPRAFEATIDQARRYAEATSRLPFVIFPYLRPPQIDQLLSLNMSGMDLSGNGLVVVPGELLIYRTGLPNKYPETNKRSNVYQGVSSLVGRVLLARPNYPSLNALQQEIERRGGAITQPTVSKVVAQLEEDLMISRGSHVMAVEKSAKLHSVRLLQAERLLDRLAAAYQSPPLRDKITGKTGMTRERLQTWMEAQASSSRLTVAVTGISSASRYSVMARPQRLVVYCSQGASLLEGLPLDTASRFPDLEIRVTDDPSVYFDTRPDGLPWACAVQTYLELKSGDPREQETAAQVRQAVLREAHGYAE